MSTLRTTLASLAFAGTALTAGAQTQQVCFTGSIPLTTTNWQNSVTIPKFDPTLGDLQSISFTLSGNVQGTAQAESLDAAPSIVNTQFSANITLTRPDLSIIVVTIPIANFSDPFTAFDGIIDFAGTSGATHANINASDTQTVNSPPPASDLVLFTGPGTISLPVAANGSSIATGSGNLITQFSTDAAADVTVCYTYLPNIPPTLNCPATIMVSAGVPTQFQVCASDANVGDVVTINATNVPPGMTFTPPLPASGNPICITVDWTPTASQVGTFQVTFTAIDTHLRSQSCTVTLVVAECHMVFSTGLGAAQVTLFGHLYDTQLAGVRRSWPVTMEDMPSFNLNQFPPAMYVQVLMYNAQMFPTNPDQYSAAMRVTRNTQGGIDTEYFGTYDGIALRAHIFYVNGVPRVRFPFTIEGM